MTRRHLAPVLGTLVLVAATPAAPAAVNAPYGPPLQLSVQVAGAGTVTGDGVDCAGRCSKFFAAPSQVELTPRAAKGHYFVGWGGACWGESACTVTVNEPQSVQAAFIALPNTVLARHHVSGSSVTVSIGATGGAGHSVFACKLDGGRYRRCGLSARFSGLSAGRHTLLIRAADSNGRRDPSPARLTFIAG